MNTFSNQVTRALSDIGIERPEGVDFLTLHDILRLMPKIGEKMGWDDGGLVDESFGWSGNPALWMWQHQSHRILDAFLSGDYPACETVLLDLLKEHGT